MYNETTFRSILRNYADGVDKGWNDSDLPAKTRKFVALFLRTASNDFAADSVYGSARLSASRDDIVQRLINQQWEGNVGEFVRIAGSNASRVAYGDAYERAIDILRNI